MFQRCYACHSVVAGEDKLPGPNLRCVLGRRAGTLAGFEFSPALVEAGAARGLVWTRAALDRFLADPQAFLPGTTMGMPGLPGVEDRRDLIDYLESAGPCGVPRGQAGSVVATAPSPARGSPSVTGGVVTT